MTTATVPPSPSVQKPIQKPIQQIDKKLVFLLSFICALTIGNLYVVQPLLEEVAQYFHRSPSEVGFVATLAQLGYGFGVLLVVPLGDLMERRALIFILLGAVTVSLVLAAFAPTLAFLAVASLLIGFTTVVPQVIIPYAASLAPPSQRASVIGTVQSGLLIGILLARTVAGLITSLSNWRGVYAVLTVVTILVSVLVKFTFPKQEVSTRASYPQLLRSMWTIFLKYPVLRRVSISGALNFAVFSSFWTSLAFLLESSFHYGPAAAGLFGLVGVVGALIAGFAGKSADRYGARIVQMSSLGVTLLSFLIFLFAEHSIALLVIGVIVMDAGVQANHIACQADVFSLEPDARSRLNGIYMVIRFIGGALGSTIGAWSWHQYGWAGVSVSGLIVCIVGIIPLLGLKTKVSLEA